MMEAAKITEILGGKRVMGKTVSSSADFIPLIRSGFSYRSLEKLVAYLGLRLETVLTSLAINERTIRRKSAASRLSQPESEKVYRLARLTALAEEVFEDRQAAQLWLTNPIPALGGVTPLSLLDTEEGARWAETELQRLAWGVYS
jgi:putative toxin-antitoxin system antitoxin component (TIGR02293 family)